MKVTKWWKKVATSLVAAGMLSPYAAEAVDIPLGDPSFEAYNVTPHGGFSYASPTPSLGYTGGYRPTSAWIGNPGDASGPVDGDADDSNWLYNVAYAEGVTTKRASPRTGNQAMHGRFQYSGQVTSELFEAGKTYTFSVYSQGDHNTTAIFDESRVFLYLFNGSIPFSEDSSLAFDEYSPLTGDFINRPIPPATAAQSKALWQKISISRTFHTGDPAVGQPVGVAFWVGPDGAVDDASLTKTSTVLTLEVRTTDGQVRIVNETGRPVPMDYYEITSVAGSLNKNGWNGFQEQGNVGGFPAGNGTGNGWEAFDLANDKVVGEEFLQANTLGNSFVGLSPIGLGQAYQTGDLQDLQFRYAKVPEKSLTADFNQDGDVDGGDFLAWQRNVGSFGAAITLAQGNANTDQTINAQDLAIWEEEYSNVAGANGIGELVRGHVRFVPAFGITAVPEPTSVVLAGLGIFAFMSRRLGGNRKGSSS